MREEAIEAMARAVHRSFHNNLSDEEHRHQWQELTDRMIRDQHLFVATTALDADDGPTPETLRHAAERRV